MVNGNEIQRAPITIGQRGFELRSLDDVWRFASIVVASGLAPKDITRPETAAIAIQYGMEIGIPPMRAMQSIAVINGRPTLWGDTMLGLCIGHPSFDGKQFKEWFEGKPLTDEWTACCQVCRIGREPVVSRFSVVDAKRASLWGKAGPWQQYPQRMLKLRARAWALRDEFCDVLGGFGMAEEMQDVREVTAEVIESKPAAPKNGVAGLKARLQAEPKPAPEIEAPAETTAAPVDTGHATDTPDVAVEPPTPIDGAANDRHGDELDHAVEALTAAGLTPAEPVSVTKSGLRVPAASLAERHRRRTGD